MMGAYGAYVWRSAGWSGIASRAVIPLLGLVVFQRVGLMGINWVREGLYSGKRKNLV